MTRERGPEEFFEVFREVQSTRKKRQEAAQAAEELAQGDEAVEPAAAVPGPEAAAEPTGVGAGPLARSIEVSVPVAGAVVAGALLLVAAAYMLGKQRGWHAHARAVERAAATPRDRPGTQAGPGPAAVSTKPELVKGKVFTLVTYRRSPQHRELAQLEADYLNEHPRFQALSLQAYVYQDRNGVYRLCVRGLLAKGEAERAAAEDTVRKLRSRQNQLAYEHADYYAP